MSGAEYGYLQMLYARFSFQRGGATLRKGQQLSNYATLAIEFVRSVNQHGTVFVSPVWSDGRFSIDSGELSITLRGSESERRAVRDELLKTHLTIAC